MEGTATTDTVSDSDFRKEFYIPNYILVPESKPDSTPPPQLPQCPVLVFINSKSGGQLGADLFKTYSALLNENQVTLSCFEFLFSDGKSVIYLYMFLMDFLGV